jgi:muconate cycloisomerase
MALTRAPIERRRVSPGICAEEYPCAMLGPFFYEGDILAEPLSISGGSARLTE